MKNTHQLLRLFIYALFYIQPGAARPARLSGHLDMDSIYRLIDRNNNPYKKYSKEEDMYDYLYRSLYNEQLGNHPGPATDILLILTEKASARKDTVSIKQLLEKIKQLQQTSSEEYPLHFAVNTLYSSFYKAKYTETRDETLIDAIQLYKYKSIALYESGKMKGPEVEVSVSLLHIQIAEYELKRENPDFEIIDRHIKKSKELAGDTQNTLPYICISYVRSLVYYALGDMKQSESQALITNELIDNYRKYGYQQLYAKNYALLSMINEKKGDYKNALKYEALKSDNELEIHDNTVKTIELQIITEAKDAEVADLKTQNEFQKRRSRFVTVACLLLFITILLLLAVFYVKRKNMKRRTMLEKKAKEDAVLRLKLKNEQAEKAFLEKYDVLSDFYLKEMELMGKSKELEELKTAKRKLDEQVELFAKKTMEYEKPVHTGQDYSTKIPLYEVIREDIEYLISKYLKNKKEYHEKLCRLNETCINHIKNRCNGNISVQYIKYCLCFMIGMEIAEVSACFSIEQTSVHGLRYRLKKKFGLGPDDSLELFLIAIQANTVSIKTTD